MKFTVFHILVFLIIIAGFPLSGTYSETKSLNGDLSEFKSGFVVLPRQNFEPLVISTGTERTREIGMDMMNRGGNAIDAALACALARI